MTEDRCSGLRGRLVQYTTPVWGPLVEAVGERLAAGFMWMHEAQLSDGTCLHAYKHIHTRRYLYLTVDVRAFEPMPCGRFVALRLDFAIERAMCTWWILSGWEAEDAEAVGDAVDRAAERAAAAT